MKSASEAIDVLDFQFKLQCKLKIFEDEYPVKKPCSLVSAASRYGLIFVGCSSPKLQVIQFSTIEENVSIQKNVENYSRRYVNLPSIPLHLSVNCDHTILAIVIEKNACPTVLFYSVPSFVKQNVELLKEIRLSSMPGVEVVEVNWNPSISMVFTACKSDNTLSVYEMKNQALDINELPAASGATCFCWSPKGKQIAVGSKDGKITQYKPDLKAVKIINAPQFSQPYSLISLQWISNYQFIGTFKPSDGSEESCCVVLIVAPKTGEPKFTNFYDVCFSNGTYRAPQFYMLQEQHWNILMIASANGMEVGVLAANGDNWVQWTLNDNARAELPLDSNHEEMYPIGVAVDTSSSKMVPWGEGNLPPVPYLLLLSNKGVLCCFKMINLKPNAPSATSPVEQLQDLSGLSAFVTEGSIVKAKEIKPKEIEVTTTSLIKNTASKTEAAAQPVQIEIKPSPVSSQFSFANMASSANLFSANPQSTDAPGILATSFKPIQQSASASNIFETKAAQQPAPSAVNIFGNKEPAQDFKPAPASNIFNLKTQESNLFSVKTTQPGSLFGGQISLTYLGDSNKTAASKMGTMLLGNMEQASTSSEIKTVAKSSNIPAQSVFKEPIAKPPALIPKAVAPIQETKANQVIKKEIDDTKVIRTEMIQFEIQSIEAELKMFLSEDKNPKFAFESNSISKISNNLRELEEFFEQIMETNRAQTSEIHFLKQSTLQSWAWLEEARQRFSNKYVNAIEKLKPLDSVSEKHLDSLQLMEYYLDSQMKQANAALDEQWDNFQEFCKKVHQIKTPTMEAIFQAMVKQNAVLQKQDYILRDISTRIKHKKRSNVTPSLINSFSANETLEESFQKLHLEPEDVQEIFNLRVMNRIKSLTPTKVDKLRDILSSRDVTYVTSKSQIKPTKVGSVDIKSNKLHNPLAREVTRTLNFAQSTPLVAKTDYPEKKTQYTDVPSSPISAFASIPSLTSGDKQSIPSQPKVFAENQPTAVSSGGNIILKAKEPDAKSTSVFSFGTNSLPKNIFSSTPNPVLNITTPLPISSSSSGLVISQSNATLTTTVSVLTANTVSNKTNTGILSSQSNVAPLTTTAQSLQPITSFTKMTGSTLPFQFSKSSTTNSFLSNNPLFGNQTIKNTSVSSSLDAFSTSSDNLIISTAVTTVTSSLSSSKATINTSFDINSTTNNALTSSSLPFNFSIASLSVPKESVQTTSTSSTVLNTKPFTFGAPVTPASEANVGVPLNFTLSKDNLSDESNKNVSSAISSKTISNVPLFGKTTTVVQPISIGSVSSTVFGVNAQSSTSIFSPSTNTNTKATSEIPTIQQNVAGNVSNTQEVTTPQKSLAISISSQVVITSPQMSHISSSTTTPFKATTTVVSESNASKSIFAATSKSDPITTPPVSIPLNNFSTLVFNKNTDSTSASAFDSVSQFPKTTATNSNVFGSTSSVTTTSGGVFGSTVATSSSFSGFGGNSIFGASTTTATSPSVFGGPTSTTSAFGSTATTSAFGNTATTSAFGSTATTSQSVFGGASKSIFEQNLNPSFGTSTTQSIFGGTTSASAAFGNNTSVFGSNTTSASIFGNAMTSQPVFGTSSTSTIFGSSPSTQPQSVFSTSAPSIFGNTTTTQSIFGGSASPFNTTSPFSSSSNSVFGQAASTSASVFGSTSFGAPITSASPFGKPVFGQPSFGTTQNSFGGVNTPASTTNSIFGQNTFGNNSAFGQASSSNVFNSPVSSPSVFGTPTSSSAFGSTPAFGNQTSSSSTFGQSTGNVFGNPPSNVFGASTGTNNASFGFGGLNVGSSGSQSPFGKSTDAKSIFGGKSTTFGNNNASSIFGNQQNTSNFSSSSSFGQTSFGNNTSFGAQTSSGPFSGGNQSIAQTGFGSPNAFQKPTTGFGSAPSFGGAPAFGGSPTFGGTPTFGGAPTFGTPEKVFGGGVAPQPTSGFGESATFGNLANQNTIGFGNLAQQSSPMQQPFSGPASFSTWR